MSGKPERPQIMIGPYLGEINRARRSLKREASISSAALALYSSSQIGKQCVFVVPLARNSPFRFGAVREKARFGKDVVAIALRSSRRLQRRLCHVRSESTVSVYSEFVQRRTSVRTVRIAEPKTALVQRRTMDKHC